MALRVLEILPNTTVIDGIFEKIKEFKTSEIISQGSLLLNKTFVGL